MVSGSTPSMVSFPPCKINVGLNIISKRDDGYHNILTVFYPVPWHDILEIIPSKKASFTVTGQPVPGSAKENLCLQAYDILKEDFKLVPVSIHLHKIIPMGAGLGGGSSDAAYTLRTLNELFDLSLSHEALRNYAARLGSDCAFFIEEKPVLGSGRGEVLTDIRISLKGKFLVIVKPEVQISTASAYANSSPGKPTVDLRTIMEKHAVNEWRGLLKNDFEDNLFKQFPFIQSIHQKLYATGAQYASLSGSGSSVFGIFEKAIDLRNRFEGLTYWSGYLN
ncbi:MAG: 4-(cytidine 5'-diphospho)-2-C-methyl-D-erythritol kinase [Cyclobacteriaceae bacterium]